MTIITAGLQADPTRTVKSLPLDERVTYTVAVGTDAPTTLLFPSAPSALEGAHLSANAAEDPAVLLAYHEGNAFLTVRALRKEVRAALNLLLDGRLVVLNFVGSETPDRAVRFFLPEAGAVPPARVKALVAQAQQAASVPTEIQPQFDRAEPGTTVAHRGFTATIAKVFRFDPEGVLVFAVRLSNQGKAPVRYQPDGIAVRCGAEIYPVDWTDASGSVPPGSTLVWLAVTAPLSPRAEWSVLFPPSS